jgi:hypothetical protein
MNQKEEFLPGALYRQYVESAVRDIQPYVSSQTGLVHVHRDLYSGIPVQAAPTYENFLYALLLFRRKTLESMQQGKELLDHLLSFQNLDPSSDQQGNFPALLTDYPLCKDWHLPVSLCLVMMALRTSFDVQLGEELKNRLHEAHTALAACAIRNKKKSSTAGWAAFVMALQELLLGSPVQSESKLNDIDGAARVFSEGREWLHPESFGRVLAALTHLQCKQMRLPPSLLGLGRKMWHPEASTYDGPALGVFQFGDVPETTLFDCIMSIYYNIPIKNRPWPYLTSLELALITPPEEVSSNPMDIQHWSVEKPYNMWNVRDATVSACFFVPKVSELYGFHPIRVVTPTETLVFHFPSGQLLELVQDKNQFTGKMKVNEIKEDDPTLFTVFVERREGTKILVDGEKASTFKPEKGFIISNGLSKVHIAAQSLASCCFGHVSLGNRPGQMLSKQKNETVAYDWKMSFDFVRGEVPEELSFTFDILN